MKLRGRFTFWFALAAIVPIALAALATRQVLSQSYRSDFDKQRRDAQESASQEVAKLISEVENQVRALASVDHKFVGGVIVNLQKNDGILPSTARRRLVQDSGPTMKAYNLDILFLVEKNGTVITAPHNRGVRDSVDRSLRMRGKESAGRAFFSMEQVIRGDTLEAELAVVAGRVVRDQGQEIAVLLGKHVGERIVDVVRREGRVDARMVDSSGKVAVPGTSKWARWGGETTLRVPLPGPAKKPVGWVEIEVSDSKLGVVLREVTLASGVLAGAALIFTILLGLMVARRMTRDLDALVLGAQAVSRDHYEHRVEVRSSDEIAEVAKAFNTMLEDLVESKERLGMAERIAAWQEIARRLAHEIKNPLTPIQMSVETMRKTHAKNHPSFGEIFEESTLTILEETDRLKRIVSEFSEFARMPKPRKGPCELNEIISSAISLYRGSIDVQTELEKGLPVIQADRDQLTQVVLNLMENARDAIGAGKEEKGLIVVRTRILPDSDIVELTISDNGPGIADAVKEKLFTPYFTTKHGKGGTGLGLATVHRIVTDHGGKIRFGNSKSTGGAEFVIAMPTGPSPLALTFRSVRTD